MQSSTWQAPGAGNSQQVFEMTEKQGPLESTPKSNARPAKLYRANASNVLMNFGSLCPPMYLPACTIRVLTRVPGMIECLSTWQNRVDEPPWQAYDLLQAPKVFNSSARFCKNRSNR